MASFVKFTPLSGAKQGAGVPVSYLLEIDEAKILLDCGIDESFNSDHLHALKKLARNIDAVLISHGDLIHAGGLPFLTSYGLGAPILATLPVRHLAPAALQDAHQAYLEAHGTSPPISTTQMDNAFESMTHLRYSQPYALGGSAKGIIVTPFAAGHTLGGAFWRIRKRNEDIVYFVSYNHKREQHLDGAALEAIGRPTLLITDTSQALSVHVTRIERDKQLIDTILNTMKKEGNVLVPVDSAFRVLELAYILDQYWHAQRLNTPLILLSSQCKRVSDFAKSMLEWTSGQLMRTFDQDRNNPFDFRALRLCNSVEEVMALPEPRVVLASLDSMETGYSRKLLAEWAGVAKNAIVFNQNIREGTMAHRVVHGGRNEKITIEIKERVPLEGEELARYMAEEQERKEQEAAETAYAALIKKRQLQEDHEEEEEEEGINDGTVPNLIDREEQDTTAADELAAINSAKMLKQVFWTDFRNDLFLALPSTNSVLVDPESWSLKPLAGELCFQIFPHRETRRRTDEYGEQVDPVEFDTTTIESSNRAMRTATMTMLDTLPLAKANVGDIVKEEQAKPTKWISQEASVFIKCERVSIDFSGLTDGRSIKTIVSKINPRKLILIGGDRESTEYLYHHFSLTPDFAGDIMAPGLNEAINVSASSDLIQAVLSDTLLAALKVIQYGEYELAYLQGLTRAETDDTEDDKESKKEVDIMQTDDTAELAPEEETSNMLRPVNAVRTAILDQIPSSTMTVLSTQRTSLLLGQPKLGEFRKLLQSQSLAADFVEGVLLCNGRVALRRDPITDQLVLEGPLCEEYYKVRALLYSQMAIL